MKKKTLFKTALILFTLSSLLLTACSSLNPKINLETNRIDLGEVVVGEIITREVRLINEGDAPLEILSVSTSCGCTSASVDSTTILQSENATLTIEYDSGAHDVAGNGSVHRQIFIASNDPVQPEVVIDMTADILLEPKN